VRVAQPPGRPCSPESEAHPGIQQRLFLCAELGYPEKSIEHCELVREGWKQWNEEHGFNFRVQARHSHNSDRARLQAGDEAEEDDAPPPPYLDLLV
jgi:hypothetical protein